MVTLGRSWVKGRGSVLGRRRRNKREKKRRKGIWVEGEEALC